MKKITYLILMAVLIASMTGCEKQSAVNVSAAISLKSSLEEIEAVFESESLFTTFPCLQIFAGIQ